MKKKIAIIGASALQNPLILKAKSMGLETHVFAWAAGDIGEQTADYFYPISIIEKEEILEVCRRVGIDGICSIASDLATLTVNYVANALGLTGNSLRCTHISTNKAAMRQAFLSQGDPSPLFRVVKEGEVPYRQLPGQEISTETVHCREVPYRQLLKDVRRLGYPVIVKPVDRSGSRGVTRVADEAGLEAAIANARLESFSGDVIIESFIRGKEYSVECLSCRGRHTLLQITEKFTTGAPHYIETGHREPAPLTPEIREAVKSVVLHALDSLEIENGASHSEIRIDENGKIMLIEIGARMGGDYIGSHLLPITCGFDYVGAVIRIALGEIVTPEIHCTGREAYVRFVLTSEDLSEYDRAVREDPGSIILSEIHRDNLEKVTDSSNRHGFWVRSTCHVEQSEGF